MKKRLGEFLASDAARFARE